jgi:hypothetical protein
MLMAKKGFSMLDFGSLLAFTCTVSPCSMKGMATSQMINFFEMASSMSDINDEQRENGDKSKDRGLLTLKGHRMKAVRSYY